MDVFRFVNSTAFWEHRKRAAYRFSSLEPAGLSLAGFETAEHVKLWLDDVREAPEGYVRCKSVNETKRQIVEWEGQIYCNRGRKSSLM